jgi:hypothetical protein
MSPCSNLYRIQTTILTLIAQFLLEACIPEIFQSLALSASVSQGHVSLTKDILCRPWTDLSRMTRSGLCVCAMTRHPGPAVLPSCSTLQQYPGSGGQTLGSPQCVSRWSHAFRSSFPGPLCGYNEQEHGKASVSQCSHRDGS